MNNRQIFIFISLFFLFAIRCIIIINSYSVTADEPVYMSSGQIQLTKNIFLEKRNPPLIRLIQSIPLFFTNAEAPDLNQELLSLKNKYIIGERFLYHNNIPAHSIIILTRLMTLLLSLFLGYLIYLFSSKINNSVSAGILSVFVYTFIPVMIGYSSLTTTEIGSSLFFMSTIYFLWKLLKEPYQRVYLIFFGLSLGCALSAKFSNLILVPIILILSLFNLKTLKIFSIKRCLIVIFLAFTIILFCNNFSIMPYLKGLRIILNDITITGHDTYFMGTNSSKGGWWYYYIVAFLIITPIPVIILLLMSLSSDIKGKSFDKGRLFIYLPVIIYFIVVSKSMMQSPRYLLPIYPFVIVAIGAVTKIKVQVKKYVIYVSCIWLLVLSVTIHPYYLNYFNEIIGGSVNGYKYLQTDWGQNLNFLKDYMKKNNINNVILNYAGGSSLA
ncbi:MAG: hypothetical protein C0412_21375, partial [Flavobacterium sp.]|nr:hypothetical protein [Flavobacterium sp.]